MFCKYCGNKIDEGVMFCGYCGKKQFTNSDTRKNVNVRFLLYIITVVLWILLLFSYSLPWYKISTDKIRNSIMNEVENEYGIIGSFVVDEYLDDAIGLTSYKDDISESPIEYWSMDTESTKGANMVKIACVGIFVILISLAIFSIKENKTIVNIIISLISFLFTIGFGIYMGNITSYYSEHGFIDGKEFAYFRFPNIDGNVPKEIIELCLVPQFGLFLSAFVSIGLLVVSIVAFLKRDSKNV